MNETTWLEDMCEYYNVVRFSTALAQSAVLVQYGERALWVSADGATVKEVKEGEQASLDGGRLLVISTSARWLKTYVSEVADL